LKQSGAEAQASDISDVEQRLDLWSGTLTSRFKVEGKQVTVKTAVHPAQALLAVVIESPLIAEGRLAVRVAFPYGSSSMQAADWNQPDKHQTTLLHQSLNSVELHRRLDADAYFASFNWGSRAALTEHSAHTFVLTPSRESTRLEFTAAFAPHQFQQALPSTNATFDASARHWQRFWTSGGAIELAESRDQRAPELERRIVLSQYLTAIQCAGSLPPQETGLTVNSWYGKYHLEMHWWHAAHFALWNRLPLLEKSLGWYDLDFAAGARVGQVARLRGRALAEDDCAGRARQPFAHWAAADLATAAPDLLRGAVLPCRAAIARRSNAIVPSSSSRRSSWPRSRSLISKTQRYVLGPPLIPAQENHPPRETVESDLRVVVLDFRFEDGTALARAFGHAAQARMGSRD
jgi:hypothetical protein